ncbi:MAG TPA: response regulator [Candidatus Acidoferrales bacterium]|nr:response regulator [Candidatus Acidoferrales bacterium]
MISPRTSDRIRVILADDSDATRRIVRSVLQEDPGIQVIGETQSSSNVCILLALRPDVAVVDLHMLDREMISVLANTDPKTCILAMSALVSAESMELAQTFGIDEVLEKCDLSTTLVPAVKNAFGVRDRGQSLNAPEASLSEIIGSLNLSGRIDPAN